MARKEQGKPHQQNSQKKLTLSRRTLRDLASRKGRTEAIRGGALMLKTNKGDCI